MQSGDIIVKLGGNDIKNIYDYTYVIGDIKIDEEIEIEVLRDGKRLKLKITPGSRDWDYKNKVKRQDQFFVD